MSTEKLLSFFFFCKVKAGVSNNFDYVLELIFLKTEEFVCLLALTVLNMETAESVRQSGQHITENSTPEGHSQYLDFICSSVVKHSLDTFRLKRMTMQLFLCFAA